MTEGRPLIDILCPDESPIAPPLDLAARLRGMLDRRWLTVRSVAKSAGMKPQQVHAILDGKVPNPGVLTVARIAAAAGGSLQELFADDE